MVCQRQVRAFVSAIPLEYIGRWIGSALGKGQLI
jgi:hypothetical protein